MALVSLSPHPPEDSLRVVREWLVQRCMCSYWDDCAHATNVFAYTASANHEIVDLVTSSSGFSEDHAGILEIVCD